MYCGEFDNWCNIATICTSTSDIQAVTKKNTNPDYPESVCYIVDCEDQCENGYYESLSAKLQSTLLLALIAVFFALV